MGGADHHPEDEAGTAQTWVSVAGASGDVRSGQRARDAGPKPEPSDAVLQRYEVLEELGRGGMGMVIAARDKQLGRTVAVKVLHGDLCEHPAVLRRFMIEAQVGAQLEHPNIVPVYAMEAGGSAPAFTMRMLSGLTLRAYVKECREKPESEDHALPERLEHFLKVCDAVAYAHSEGVIHRDLKPDNVILGEHHEVYLVDWGVAKVLGADEEPLEGDGHSSLSDALDAAERRSSGGVVSASGSVRVDAPGATQHGELVGTPMYMPPEQASGEIARHGPASDSLRARDDPAGAHHAGVSARGRADEAGVLGGRRGAKAAGEDGRRAGGATPRCGPSWPRRRSRSRRIATRAWRRSPTMCAASRAARRSRSCRTRGRRGCGAA